MKLKIGGPNRSKFKLSTTELGTDGGSFTVSFHSSDEGVHEAYVRLTSRGAADKYVALAVHNTMATGIDAIPAAAAHIVVCDIAAALPILIADHGFSAVNTRPQAKPDFSLQKKRRQETSAFFISLF